MQSWKTWQVFLGIPRCTFSGIARILGGSITSFYGPETPLSVVWNLDDVINEKLKKPLSVEKVPQGLLL